VTLGIRDFGDELLRTRDLDPVYVAIHGARLRRPQLCRLLTAYWCFYHLGAAAWLSEHESDDYWRVVRVAAENAAPTPRGERWPRAAERRHFRGAVCVRTVDWLARESPEHWVESLSSLRTDAEVMSAVREWPLHGPWIAFKAADMLERCAGQRVTFAADVGLIYAEPRSTLDLLVETEGRGVQDHYRDLLRYFGRRRAPPGFDRACGPQEVETVLCKWKSHRAGRYAVGKDVTEVRRALTGWGETADRLLRAAPEEVR
jgi:hypothetical protein